MIRYIFAILLLFATPVWALEVEGVALPDSVTVEGKELSLNGAGVRTKFFFDIYVGALYLASPTTNAEAAIAGNLPKRVTMDILYDEVESQKLTDGWTEGFKKNQSEKVFKDLQPRLKSFNAMFSDAHPGDQFVFDFLTDGSTKVTLKGQQAGVIEGVDFQQALLAIWLGKKPADKDLKNAMLQGH